MINDVKLHSYLSSSNHLTDNYYFTYFVTLEGAVSRIASRTRVLRELLLASVAV